MHAAILTVGDELLAGDTENTNATWLCRQLADRGVSVKRVLTVPDELDAIADAVRVFSANYDAVIVTGGLGGTPDDITMDGVAAGFDRELEANDLAREDVERTLAAIADDYPDLNVDIAAEATLPAGARPLLNREGLSPGCVVENVYVLPGIPGEMKAMFGDIESEFAGSVVSAFLYTEEPEANLIDRLREAGSKFDVQVGCYPDREQEHNRLKVSGEDAAAVEEAKNWLAANVETVAGENADDA
ncbi:competence/damage-inducible protein A [Natronomonas sp. EA1]|uniref:competence/damage-inducible protein A n=1 Tax=Natronomonas sp. EA1 TaxID=3421655 RepID=UPI003EBFDC42